MTDRILSEALAARMLLGAMMLSESESSKALSGLRADAMVGPERTVLEALRALIEHGQSCALPMVIEYLQAHEKLAEVGGAAELCSWCDSRLPSESVLGIVEQVNGASLRRELQKAGQDITSEAENPPWVEEALEFADKRIAALHAPRSDRPQTVGEILAEMRDHPQVQIATGFSHFDNLLSGGLRAGNLCVIGGRPGMGKTALCVAIADRIALSGSRVLFVSTEMSKQEIVNDRLAALHPRGIPDGLAITMIRTTKLGDVRAMMMRVKPAVVVLDFLQEMRGRGEKRYEQVDYVSRNLKNMAMESQLPFVVAAAVNRGPEEGGKLRPPVLSDLREGGDLEYAADIVAFVHRPKPYDAADNEAVLHVVKQRNGPPGIVKMIFLRSQKTFAEVSDRMPPELGVDWS